MTLFATMKSAGRRLPVQRRGAAARAAITMLAIGRRGAGPGVCLDSWGYPSRAGPTCWGKCAKIPKKLAKTPVKAYVAPANPFL
jgi:hypothetical protein